MHRIDAQGHVGNRFTEGNPAAGQMATRVSSAFLNDVQENICRVIEQAGLTLAKGAEDQLYLAIVQLAAGAVGTGGGSVPATRQINSSGALTGGGTLANDLALSVPIASPAEIVDGLTDKVVTPAGLAAAMAGVKSPFGRVILPGGFIMQWGTGTALPNTSTLINMPYTFPAACAWAGVEGGNQIGDANDNNPTVVGRGVNTLSVWNAVNQSVPVSFFAIGY